MTSGFVAAFRGRRDNYELALALHEVGLLKGFVHDFYFPSFFARHMSFCRSRNKKGLPYSKVWIPSRLIINELKLRSLSWGRPNWESLDRLYSEVASQKAKTGKSHLFLYHPYAFEAFNRSYQFSIKKYLFVFDPYSFALDSHSEITRYMQGLPENMIQSFASLNFSKEFPPRFKMLDKADVIVCASSFVKQSLIAAGADEKYIHCLPYGVDAPDKMPLQAQQSRCGFHVLFVGSCSLRKGIAHLILAWEKANLPQGSQLTIVSRSYQKQMNKVIHSLQGVRFIEKPSDEALCKLYQEADIMAMPSLCEGFGQVYLEALAQGCPVLGTQFTGLSDIGSEDEGVYSVEAGNIDALVTKLEELSQILPQNNFIRLRAHTCAKRHSWKDFRKGIQSLISI